MTQFQPGIKVDDLMNFGEDLQNIDSYTNQPITNQVDQTVKKPKRGYANKRERVRTENVNAGFDKLRKLIPTDPIDRKLSKIEVLRLAVSYINHLYNLTKANSCLEAESKCDESSEASSGEDSDTRDKHNPGTRANLTAPRRNDLGSNKKHVCTFCLMMTKAITPSSSTKRK